MPSLSQVTAGRWAQVAVIPEPLALPLCCTVCCTVPTAHPPAAAHLLAWP